MIDAVSFGTCYDAILSNGQLTCCPGAMHSLFRRCVRCESSNPGCPVCAADQTCTLIVTSCEECARTECTEIGADTTTTTPSTSNNGSSVGAIVGGVFAGVSVIIIITWLVWRFCIKKRRESFESSGWPNSGEVKEKDGTDFTTQRDARASTHTVGSIASTVLTRASNVIQIAYIPGVTNRSIESTPDLLAPPVPPIPALSQYSNSNLSSPQPGQEQHFFMPSDLRDSRYSGYSDDNRTSYARSSMALTARSSVATTAYRNNAVVNPLPAQVIARGKANAVSVKSSGKNSPTDTPRSITPPIPPIDYERHGQMQGKTAGPIVARVGVPKEVTVTRTSSQNAAPTFNPPIIPSPSQSQNSQTPLVKAERPISPTDPNRHNGDASTFDDPSSEDDDSPPDQSLMGHIRKLSGSKHSAFKSASSAPNLRHSRYQSASAASSSPGSEPLLPDSQNKPHKRSGSLNQIIEEAARRASRDPRNGGLASRFKNGNDDDPSVGTLASWKKEGPFSDENAVRIA